MRGVRKTYSSISYSWFGVYCSALHLLLYFFFLKKKPFFFFFFFFYCRTAMKLVNTEENPAWFKKQITVFLFSCFLALLKGKTALLQLLFTQLVEVLPLKTWFQELKNDYSPLYIITKSYSKCWWNATYHWTLKHCVHTWIPHPQKIKGFGIWRANWGNEFN